jgi:hypothetical protein
MAGDGGVKAGTSATSTYYASYYTTHGYQLVELSWGDYTTKGTPWEEAWPLNLTSDPSFLFAACRPATFLNWVRNGNYPNVGQGIWQNTGKGMCVHADSGGSAAAAFALEWYNAGAGGAASWGSGYLDKAVLSNGPVYSNVEQGCEIDANGQNNQYEYICNGTSQFSCNAASWTQSPPIDYSLEYVGGDASSVNLWSGNNTPNACANNTVGGTTTFNTQWQQMSIVGGTAQGGGPGPSTNYPDTAISAWLCENVTDKNATLNNSMSQGELFYAQFKMPSQIWNGQLSVNGVFCPTTEDVENGTTVYNGTTYNCQDGQSPANCAYAALEADMTTGSASCNALGLIRQQQN